MTDRTNPPFRAVPMTLFPSADSLQDAVDLAMSKLPINTANDLYSVLMTYHNTLLQETTKTVK